MLSNLLAVLGVVLVVLAVLMLTNVWWACLVVGVVCLAASAAAWRSAPVPVDAAGDI